MFQFHSLYLPFPLLSISPVQKQYTNSVAPMVKSLQMNDHPEEHLKRFESVIEMKERPWLRNPFKSIHAIALANLGEFSSALVMMSLMQHVKGIKAIPVKLQVEYLMKARGKIRAECSVALEVSINAAERTLPA